MLRRHLHLFALGALTLLTACGGESGSTSEWPDFFTLEDLVAQSELVAVVALMDERSETVEVSSLTSSGSGVFPEDTIRTYRVDEVLKGTSADALDVWSSDGTSERIGGSRTQRFENFQPLPGEQYVLFLRSYDREGEMMWGRTGEPEAALLHDGQLTFLASIRYEEAARAAGRAIPETTLEDIRAMAGNIDD